MQNDGLDPAASSANEEQNKEMDEASQVENNIHWTLCHQWLPNIVWFSRQQLSLELKMYICSVDCCKTLHRTQINQGHLKKDSLHRFAEIKTIECLLTITTIIITTKTGNMCWNPF